MQRGAWFGLWNGALRGSGCAFLLLALVAEASQCPQDLAAPANRPTAAKASTTALINVVAATCRRPASAETAEAGQARSQTSKLDYASLRSVESDRVANATSDFPSEIDSRFGVRWRAVKGPEWVRNVPQWVIDDARYYKHRGLPLVQLWQSNHYQVALGLSNRGVPGVYFSQKIP